MWIRLFNKAFYIDLNLVEDDEENLLGMDIMKKFDMKIVACKKEVIFKENDEDESEEEDEEDESKEDDN